MSPRNTLIMLVLCLAVGGFWYFHDVKGGKQREEAKEKEERLFPDLESKDVNSLKVTNLKGGGPPLVLEKVDGRWLIQGDPDYLASKGEIDGVVGQVAEMKRASVILESPAPAQLKEYGLDKPRFTVEIGATAKDAPKRVLTLGDKTPDDSGYYARTTDSGPVLEVASYFMNTLEKPPAELRDKSAMAAEPGDVSRVKILQGDQEILLVKEEAPEPKEGEEPPLDSAEKWRLEKPFQAPADARQVSDFLWAWKNLKAGRFLAPDEKVDFGKPRLRLEVWEGDAKEPQVLEVGPTVPVKPDMAYVRRLGPDEGMVVTMGAQAKDLLGKTAGDFEDKHLLSFQEDEVDRITGTVDGVEVSVRRIRDGWQVEKPTPAAKDDAMRNAAVNDLLYNLKDLAWTSKEGAKFDTPRATLTLTKKGGEALGTIKVGPTATVGGTAVMREGSDTVYMVKLDPVISWKALLERMKEKPSPSPSPGAASPAAGSPGAASPAASPGG